jgi:hypothetical protein
MAIVAECAVCGKRFKAAETQAGKKAKCSQCGTVFVIAQATDSSQPQAKVGALAPPRTLSAQTSSSAPAKATAPGKVAPPTKVPAPPKVPAPSQPAVPTRVVTPTRVTASRAHSAPTEIAAPQLKPAPQDQFEPTSAAALPESNEPLPLPARRKKPWKIITFVALLAVCGTAAAVIVPKFFPKPATPVAKNNPSSTNNNAQLVSHLVSSAFPQTGPAWNTTPDVPAHTLKLPDDFRLAIPARPPLRHNPASLVLAPAPSPFVAVTLLPNADRSQPTIEVWNLYTKSRTAQFKLNQPLSHPLLSQDGGYYAGQFYDHDARAARVEVWSTSTGQRIHTVDIPSPAPLSVRAALGFPMQDQIALLGNKLQVWNLTAKNVVTEIQPPDRSEDTHAATSAKLKLIAIADSKFLTLVDLAQSKVLGRAVIPQAILDHPRRPLSLRQVQFSPDGKEIALLFDNQRATRRIAIYDVATGVLKALHSPLATMQSGGPEFQWLADSQGFLVSSGVLLDRAAGRQFGQIYTDIPEEGFGGVLTSLLADDHALAVWDKYPNNLILRSLPIQREKPDWISVNITSASAARYEQLQCVSREFGNLSAAQSLYQSGRLTDGSQFLVVDARFTASLSDDAPALLPLRSDRFILEADGQPHLPIGSIGRDGSFSLERPETDLTKGASDSRRRSIVFAVSGKEKSLSLHIASAAIPLQTPDELSVQPPPSLSGVPWEQLPPALFSAPDDAAQVSVRITSARVQPYELDPEAAQHVPLRITYSSPNASVMAVTFHMTVNTARNFTRTNKPQAPRLGLLLPDGKNIRPAVELPDILPITLGAGEQRTHTCLFLFNSPAPKFRLTYDGIPVATITPETANP